MAFFCGLCLVLDCLLFVRCYRDSRPIVCIMCFFLRTMSRSGLTCCVANSIKDKLTRYKFQLRHVAAFNVQQRWVGKPPTPNKVRHTRTNGRLDTSEGSVQPLSAHPSGIVLWEACPQICKLHHHRINDILHERKLALEVLNTIAQIGEVLQRVIASAGCFQRQCLDR